MWRPPKTCGGRVRIILARRRCPLLEVLDGPDHFYDDDDLPLGACPACSAPLLILQSSYDADETSQEFRRMQHKYIGMAESRPTSITDAIGEISRSGAAISGKLAAKPYDASET